MQTSWEWRDCYYGCGKISSACWGESPYPGFRCNSKVYNMPIILGRTVMIKRAMATRTHCRTGSTVWSSAASNRNSRWSGTACSPGCLRNSIQSYLNLPLLFPQPLVVEQLQVLYAPVVVLYPILYQQKLVHFLVGLAVMDEGPIFFA